MVSKFFEPLKILPWEVLLYYLVVSGGYIQSYFFLELYFLSLLEIYELEGALINISYSTLFKISQSIFAYGCEPVELFIGLEKSFKALKNQHSLYGQIFYIVYFLGMLRIAFGFLWHL